MLLRSAFGCASAAIAAVAVIAVLAVFGWHMEYGTEHTVTFTVKSLDDQSQGTSHKYLVFATDGEVYKNTDTWLHGKTDSSRIQAWLTPGDTYRCPVYGVRLFWASQYPDILDGCKQVAAGR